MTPEQIADALAEPFDPRVIGWKPQSAKGNRALAVAYIDARDVMDRLDAVVGVGAWQDEYEVLADGSVVCRLRVKVNDEWVTKTDVGGMSEQPDQGDRLKAAFSDALKRAAVKYGVGRYLYSLPAVWHDYDVQKKQFIGTPQLPAWAVPKAKGGQPARPPQPAPPQPPPAATADELFGLIAELAAVRRVPVADLVGTVVRKLDAKAAALDDLSAKALLDGITSVRNRLAEERPKGQQSLAGAEPARGLPD